MFLAVSSNAGDPRPLIAQESARTEELVGAGLIDRVLVKADWSGAVLLLRVQDHAAATALVDSLPLVQAGIATFELTEVADPPATAR